MESRTLERMFRNLRLGSSNPEIGMRAGVQFQGDGACKRRGLCAATESENL